LKPGWRRAAKDDIAERAQAFADFLDEQLRLFECGPAG